MKNIFIYIFKIHINFYYNFKKINKVKLKKNMYAYSSKEIRDLYNKFQLSRIEKNPKLNISDKFHKHPIFMLLEKSNNENTFKARESNLLIKQFPENRNVLKSNISTFIGEMPEEYQFRNNNNIIPQDNERIKINNDYNNYIKKEERTIIYKPNGNNNLDNIIKEYEKIIKDIELFRLYVKNEIQKIKEQKEKNDNKDNNDYTNFLEKLKLKILKLIDIYNKKEIKTFDKIEEKFLFIKEKIMKALKKRLKIHKKPIKNTNNEFKKLKMIFPEGVTNNENMIKGYDERICCLTYLIDDIDEDEEDSDYGDNERKENRKIMNNFYSHYFSKSKKKQT